MALLKISWRNIKEHKVKTLIIGIIITIGITILVIGNSMIDTAALGIKKNYTGNYTGDLIITSDTDSRLSLFGVMDINSMTEGIPTVPEYFDILEYAGSQPDILSLSSQAAGRVQLDFGKDFKSFTMLFGIDPEEYLNMFPGNIELVQGEFLKPGEAGLLLSEFIVQETEREYKIEINAGSTVLLTGISSGSGAKIRELTIRGIFHFKNSNPQLEMVSLIDIDSLRSLNGMTLGAELAVQASEDETDLIDEFDEQDLFSDDDSLFEESMVLETGDNNAHTEKDLLSILGDTSERDRLSQTDSGAWHFILLKLKDPAAAPKVAADLTGFFKEKDIPAKVSDWKSGAGPMGEMADTLKIVFNIIILIVAIVAVIIIMNTLVISITERISEIGTMRALGAKKGFVRLMVIVETIMISLIFGIIGIVLGTLILVFMGAIGIPAPNMFFEVLFGGKIFYPVISPAAIVQSLVIIILIGIISSLYPVYVALRIQPIKAIHTQ